MNQPALHPTAWLCWLLAVLVALSTIRNPLHLLLVWLCIGAVHAAQRTNQQFPGLRPLHMALALALVAALINALSVRAGTTVLFRIPEAVPLLGGPITLEAFVFGALTGLTLAGIIVAFGIVQRALPTSALIGLIPRAFAPLAIVSAIAITFVPMLLRQAAQIRDAQRIRGHRLRGIRDWIPLFLPLLINSLERSIQLAEAISSRGFAGTDQPHHSLRLRAILVTGLALLLAGWLLLLIWGQGLPGAALMVLGGTFLIGILWWAGRQVPRTRYRSYRYNPRDWAVMIGALVVLGALLSPWPGVDRSLLAYYPYPALQLPLFDPILGIATLGLLWPAARLFR